MTVPANIGFTAASIRLMEKTKKKRNRHFVIPEAHLAFIHHRRKGGLRLITAHKGWGLKQAPNLWDARMR